MQHSVMQILNERMRFIGGLGVKISVAHRADIQMLPSFERVVKGDVLGKFGAAAIALPSAHAPLKNYQRVFVLFDRIRKLVFCKYAQILENEYVVAALERPEQVRSSEHDPQIFEFGLAHLKH